MAFNGTYIEISGVQLPNKYVNNYKVTPERRTDKDSFIDGDGKLNRTILPHKRSGFTFDTGFITDDDIANLTCILNSRDVISVTKYWEPVSQTYKSGSFYVADFELEVLMSLNNKVYYRPISLEFVEY